MELVWKKNNGPQHLTIHTTVALLAIYSVFYCCIRCTLGWFFSGKVSDIFNPGVRSQVPSPELFHLWNVLIPEPKQDITQSRSKFGVTCREARFHDSQYKKRSSQAYAMKQIQIWKKVMNPFITHWDEPFAGKEKRVANFCLHGLNSDRVGRSVISPWPR